jgi:hypothetical protein
MPPYHKLTKTTMKTKNITKETDRQCRLYKKYDDYITSACQILAQKEIKDT